MVTSDPKSGWFPYTIPATPNVTAKSYGGTLNSGDPYVMSAANGASSSQNPSKHLEWSQIPINDILSRLNALEQAITDLEELKQKVNQIESRLNSASITADCSSGDIIVTLNL